MLIKILSAATTFKDYVPIIILGLFFILMVVMTIVPQRKKQKQIQSMLDGLSIGDKIMTIGRLIGTVVFIDTDKKQVTVNVGTNESQTLVVIDRNAVGYIIEKSDTAKDIVTDDTKSNNGSDKI